MVSARAACAVVVRVTQPLDAARLTMESAAVRGPDVRPVAGISKDHPMREKKC